MEIGKLLSDFYTSIYLQIFTVQYEIGMTPKNIQIIRKLLIQIKIAENPSMLFFNC